MRLGYTIVIDSYPPSPPSNITGMIDTNAARQRCPRGKARDFDRIAFCGRTTRIRSACKGRRKS